MEKAKQSPKYPIFTPDYFANWASFFNQMREEDPVYFFEPLGCWFLTRYDDVVAVLKDSQKFSSKRAEALLAGQFPEADQSFKQSYLNIVNRSSFFSDPPEHTRIRSVMNRGFTPRAMSLMQPRIKKIVDELVADLPSGKEIDLISSYVDKLTCFVIADIIGIPKSDRPLFRKQSIGVTKLIEGVPMGMEEAKQAHQCTIDMQQYIANRVSEHRGNQQEDIISFLLQGEAEGKLPNDYIASICMELVTGGINTTADFLGKAIVWLIENPSIRKQVLSNPTLWKPLIEEMLRLDPPVLMTNRLTTQDVIFGGKRIPKNSIVFVCTAAANRDPKYFKDPNKFDLSRNDETKHISFATGPHYCVGSALAKIEIELALKAFFQRFPDAKLANKPTVRVHTTLFSGYTEAKLHL